jgi:ubiquinone/menaquinone biosynthesis C-methylase UbiE
MRKILDTLLGRDTKIRKHPLVRKYLIGLNGIEIGGSGKSFGLDGQKGSYANVDIIDAATRAKSKGWKKSQLVNILSPGDDLPFKDNVFEYVFSSHVIEHFFDPIKAIKEWGRVTKAGGYIFMIIPHKERTFDKNREISGYSELISRHEKKITIRNYIQRTKEEKIKYENDKDKDHHRLVYNDDFPDNWEKFDHYDFSHHWSVWNTQSFLELCHKMNWDVIDYKDINNEESEFTVILKNK